MTLEWSDFWNFSLEDPLKGMKHLSCFYDLEYWVDFNIDHLLDTMNIK